MRQFISTFLNKFKEYIALVFLLTISLILITVNDNHKVKNIRVYTLGIFASLNSTITNFGKIFEDTDYIESLERRNAELMLEVNKLREYALENDELNKILQFKSSSQYNLITAQIVSRLISKVSGYMIISKGSADGIKPGMPVINDKGLIGIILDTDENYSSIRTFENSLFKVAVKDQRSNVDGILNWDGRNLIIKNVPTTDDVEVGDRIVVSELSTILPPSIPIGLIVQKESTLSGVLSNLVVQPFNNLTSIKNVIVLEILPENQVNELTNKLNGSDK